MQAIMLNDFNHFIASYEISCRISGWDSEYELDVSSELARSDWRSTNNQLTLIDQITLCKREYHDLNVLARVRFCPKRMPDQYFGTRLIGTAAPFFDNNGVAFPASRQRKPEAIFFVFVNHRLRQLRFGFIRAVRLLTNRLR
jgi:hypothetical protein